MPTESTRAASSYVFDLMGKSGGMNNLHEAFVALGHPRTQQRPSQRRGSAHAPIHLSVPTPSVSLSRRTRPHFELSRKNTAPAALNGKSAENSVLAKIIQSSKIQLILTYLWHTFIARCWLLPLLCLQCVPKRALKIRQTFRTINYSYMLYLQL